MGRRRCCRSWAERNGHSFAWVSVDEADNDPKVLLSYVAAALDAVEPIGERVFDALASPASSVPGSVVPRLGSAFSSMTSLVVLVLDDVHVLRIRVPGRVVGAGRSCAGAARGWRWRAGPSRRCGSLGCAPKARSDGNRPGRLVAELR